MSALDYEEAGHKLMKLRLPEGQEIELCSMICECCSQEKTFLRYYALLAARFCQKFVAYRWSTRSLYLSLFMRPRRRFVCPTSARSAGQVGAGGWGDCVGHRRDCSAPEAQRPTRMRCAVSPPASRC
jgi:MA3 domain